jgi:NAD(P)-dependent dehydrogenase (short-subunit alcohol dehydrogenase family)
MNLFTVNRIARLPLASRKVALVTGAATGIGRSRCSRSRAQDRRRGELQRERQGVAVQLIVPYVQGGGSDQRARLVARHLAESLREDIEVVNRTGAVVAATHSLSPRNSAHVNLLAQFWDDRVPHTVTILE